jgi:hypothetical protein
MVPVAVTFVVVGIVIAFGINILNDVRTDFQTKYTGPNCNQNSSGGTGTGINDQGCGWEYNATVDAIDANVNVSDKLPLLGLVVAAAIIIGVLLKAFQQ